MRIPKSNRVVPPGGYQFLDTSIQPPKRFTGHSWDNVSEKVLHDRLENGRPPGDPGREVIDQLCDLYPDRCKDSNPPEIPPSPVSLSPGPLSGRVAAWIGAFQKAASYTETTPRDEAQRRAEICVACPHNKEFRSGCGSCLGLIERVGFVLARGRAIPEERRLFACELDGQHNGLAVITSRFSRAGLTAKFPSNCWRAA